MHIAHLETGRHMYGGARQVLWLLGGLREQGVRNTLICSSGSAIEAAARQLGIDVIAVEARGDLDFGLTGRVGGALQACGADLLHVHSRRGADVWGGLAARRQQLPAVLSRRVDNPESMFLGPVKFSFYSRVIAISDMIGRQLRDAGLDGSKLRIVRSAVHMPAPGDAVDRQSFAAAFDLHPEQQFVFCVAQFIARKGQRYLLDAWPEIISEHPQARLLLFGQGPDEPRLWQQVNALGISDTVEFAGFRDDLTRLLGCADLLVHPALSEGLGVCLLEAQAAGVAVVAARAGGIPEAVAEGHSALLVEPGDSRSLAVAVNSLLTDDRRRDALGAAGRRFVAEQFAVDRMVSGNLDVYKEVLQNEKLA